MGSKNQVSLKRFQMTEAEIQLHQVPMNSSVKISQKNKNRFGLKHTSQQWAEPQVPRVTARLSENAASKSMLGSWTAVTQ